MRLYELLKSKYNVKFLIKNKDCDIVYNFATEPIKSANDDITDDLVTYKLELYTKHNATTKINELKKILEDNNFINVRVYMSEITKDGEILTHITCEDYIRR